MAKEKQFTVSEWEALENQKRAHLQETKIELEALQASRANLLLQIVDGEKEAEKALSTCEEKIAKLRIEIEGTEELLKVIPARKDYARSFEVEAKIESLEAIEKALSEQADKIDQIANSFAQAAKAYLDILDNLKIDYALDMKPSISRIPEAIGHYLHEYGLKGWVNIGVFRNNLPMPEIFGKIHRKEIDSRVRKMREHVKHLRGEIKNEIGFCPACYVGLIRGGEGRYCPTCGAKY